MKKISLIIIKYSLSFLFVVVSISLGAISPTYQQFKEKTDLARRGNTAHATVTAVECTNHDHVSYEFKVKEMTFSNTSNACGPTCGTGLIGSTLEITYLDRNPSVNDCGRIEKKADEKRDLGFLMIAACFLSAIVLALKCRKEIRHSKEV